MIEVNLLPGGKKRSGGGGKFSLALPKFGGGLPGISLPKGDRWTVGAGAAVVLAILVGAWLFMGVSGVAEERQVEVDAAVADSTRYHDLIQRTTALKNRNDSISERVDVIQEIDKKRYVWPHLMDEVARAIPEYTWMTRFNQMVRGETVSFRVEGTSGTLLAVTTFMENLEASPFIESVNLISTAQVEVPIGEGGGTQLVYDFVLDAMESIPPAEVIETVPLFDPLLVDPSGDGLAGDPVEGEG